MKLFIITAKGKQFVVPAAFNNAAFVHHNYFVRALDGTEAVGNRYGGTGTHEPVEGILHAALGFGVKRGRGFVQDQDGRVLEDGAGDADTLPLAAAELDAAVTYSIMNSWAFAIRAAASTEARSAFSTPKAILLKMVSLNNMGSWFT